MAHRLVAYSSGDQRNVGASVLTLYLSSLCLEYHEWFRARVVTCHVQYGNTHSNKFNYLRLHRCSSCQKLPEIALVQRDGFRHFRFAQIGCLHVYSQQLTVDT